MKIRYTETALIEADEIFSFIAKDNIRAAAAVVDRAQTTIDRLGHFPHLGQVANESGVRTIRVGRYPFLVFYTVEQDEIVILHVRHTARRRPWDKTG
jgi:plasmid stabilization system protein ParE